MKAFAIITCALIFGIPFARAQTAPSTQPQAEDDWHKAFYDVYRLKAGESVKYIAAPFIAERHQFYVENEDADQVKAVPNPVYLLLQQNADGNLRLNYVGWLTLYWSEAQHLMPDLRFWQMEGDASLLNAKLRDDWIVRPGADHDTIFAAIAQALSEQTHKSLTIRHSQVERDIVLVEGSLKPIDENTGNIDVLVNSAQLAAYNKLYGTPSHLAEPLSLHGTMPVLLDRITMATGVDFLIDSSAHLDEYRDLISESVNSTGTPQETREALAEQIHDSTGLTCTPRRQLVDIWTLEEK